MTEDSDDATIQRLLKELRSWDPYRRKAAIQEIARLGIKDERLNSTLITLSVNDRSEIVRVAALQTLGHDPLPQPVPVAQSKPALTRNQKVRDFLIGFVGWYVVNGAIWLVLTSGGTLYGGPTGGYGLFFNLFILPANLVALLIFTFIRRWVALGMLGSYAVNFMFAAIAGVMFNALCWIPFFVK